MCFLLLTRFSLLSIFPPTLLDFRFIKNLAFIARRFVRWGRKRWLDGTGSSTVVFIRFRVETRNGDNLPVNKSPRLHRFSNGITSDRVDEERVASDCVYVRARGRVNYSSERTLCRSRLPIVHEHPGIRDEVASPLLRSDDSRKSEWRNRVDAGRG